MTKDRNSKLYLEGLLGLLSAFGPFVMDMYLAAFPHIAEYYAASPSQVQLSLATCTVGLAIGQLLFGTVSDSMGRKTPLLFSLLLYVLSAIGCILAPSIGLFVIIRFFQGLSAAGGVVISRSIVADCYSGSALAKMFGIIGLINGVSTVASPMFGGFVIEAAGWKGVFWLLLGIGAVMAVGTLFFRESLPRESRIKLNLNDLIAGIRAVIRNQKYTRTTAEYGCIMAMIFINLASGPFIMDEYGLSAEKISIIFGINAIALGVTAAIAPKFGSMEKVIRFSDTGMFVFSVVLGVALCLRLDFWIYETLVFMVYIFIGALCTATTTVAMDSERKNAGIASAFFGAIGYIAGGIISPFVGIGDIYITASVLFVFVSAIAWFISHLDVLISSR